jgi:FkbM family methyltransferase
MMTPVEIRIGTYRFLVPEDDRIFTNQIFTKRHHVDEVKRLLSGIQRVRDPIPPSSEVVEFGACMGVSTIPLARHFQHVHAIEPSASNYDLLVRNLELNSARNVHAYRFAMSDHDGVGKLTTSGNNCGGYRIVPAGRDTEEVELCTVDRLIEECMIDQLKVGLVWCDVQGSEIELLRTSRTVFARALWYIEFHFGLLDRTGEWSRMAKLIDDMPDRFSFWSDTSDWKKRGIAEFPVQAANFRRTKYRNILFWNES